MLEISATGIVSNILPKNGIAPPKPTFIYAPVPKLIISCLKPYILGAVLVLNDSSEE